MDLTTAKDIVGKAIGAALQQLGDPPPVVAVVFVPFVVESGEGALAFGPACVTSGKDAPVGDLMGLASSSLAEADPRPVKVTRVPETGGGS